MRKRIVALVLILTIALQCLPVMADVISDRYNTASSLLAAERWGEAADAFKALGGYRDSSLCAMYAKAYQMAEDGKYSAAISSFQTLGGFYDSTLLSVYFTARYYESVADYESAYDIYATMLAFKDSEERYEAIPNLIIERDASAAYATADAAEKAGNLNKAYSGFIALGSYSDSAARAASLKEQIQERDAAATEAANAAAYAAADAAQQRGDLSTAYTGFIALKNYSDSKERANAIEQPGKYAAAMKKALNGDYAGAYADFIALGNYEDSERKAYVLSVYPWSTMKSKGDGLIAFQFHDVYGLINLYENEITPAYWDSIGTFNTYDLANMSESGKYGLLNTLGEVVVQAKYDRIESFDANGLAQVRLNNKYGLINTTGNVVVTIKYDSIDSFDSNDLAKVCSNGKYGMVSTTGSTVVTVQWDEISPNNDDLYTVAQKSGNNTLFGIVNKNGSVVTMASWRTLGDSYNSNWGNKYNSARISRPVFTNGMIKVQTTSGTWGYIDSKGTTLTDAWWNSIGDFHEGYALVTKNGKYGFINSELKTAIPAIYVRAYDFSDGYAAYVENDLFGYIDQQNQVIIPPRYAKATSFGNGIAEVYLEGKGWNVIDKEGKMVYFIGNEMDRMYRKATAHFAAGEYDEAIALFAELGDYLDAFTQLGATYYAQGESKRNASDWKGAVTAFTNAGTYSDAKDQIDATYYLEGETKRNAGDWASAVTAFTNAGTYSDAKDQIPVTYYMEGEAKRNAGDWAGAVTAFTNAGTYSDAKDQIPVTYYMEGEAKRNVGDWAGAVTAFTNAGTYSDAKDQIGATYYLEGETKRDANDWKGAVTAFMNAGAYSDAKEQIVAIGDHYYVTQQYDLAETLFAQMIDTGVSAQRLYELGQYYEQLGNYEHAAKAYKEAGSYQDAPKKASDIQKEVDYQAAEALYAAQKWEGAKAAYAKIKGYKDVDSKIRSCDNEIAAAAAVAAFEAAWQPGKYVTYGQYPQTKAGNDNTPIEWLVLARDGQKALLISRYALDCQPYNSSKVDMTWQKCSLRTWLNGTFLNKAFTSSEQKGIVTTNVDNSKSQGYSKNDTNGGNNTQDKVFLLSYTEAWKYFKDDNARMCVPTEYAVKQGARTDSKYKVDGKATCWWWLRSPGLFQNYAFNVTGDGSRGGNDVGGRIRAVRPAIWVDLGSGVF